MLNFELLMRRLQAMRCLLWQRQWTRWEELLLSDVSAAHGSELSRHGEFNRFYCGNGLQWSNEIRASSRLGGTGVAFARRESIDTYTQSAYITSLTTSAFARRESIDTYTQSAYITSLTTSYQALIKWCVV